MNKKKMDTSDVGLVRTEIEILKVCQQPNIIRLYDVFENLDYIYIIMEKNPEESKIKVEERKAEEDKTEEGKKEEETKEEETKEGVDMRKTLMMKSS